ncbi:MAG: hypothetical protein ABR548_08280 [Actinomycetota bacterium]|nr:hypothetical protein [Actinomycetota bacterium]
MSKPFVYVGTWTVKEGQEEAARKWLTEHTDFVETNEPRLISFQVFFDVDYHTCTVVQVHPDSTSMEFHMQLISDHVSNAFAEFIDRILTEQYYGPMSDALAETLAKWEDPGVTVIKRPVHETGFTRSNVR